MSEANSIPPTTNSNDLSSRLEVISKCAIFLGGVCYVFGLVVINFHLRRYNLFSLGFFRTSYILAGGWSIIILLISAFCVAHYQTRYWEKENAKEDFAKAAFFMFVAPIVFAEFLFFILVGTYDIFSIMGYILAESLIASGIWWYFAYSIYSPEAHPETLKQFVVRGDFATVLWLLPFLFLYLTLFSFGICSV